MNFDYELTLFIAILLSGIIYLLDVVYFSKKRKLARKKKLPVLIDYSRSFFPILLLVFSVRSFAYEPRYIPTGSLKPTLLVGDLILVNKYAYGVRLPVLHTKIIANGEPKRGDIVIFKERSQYPKDTLIKRVAGVPGDHLSYVDKVLYINGIKANQVFDGYDTDQNEDDDVTWRVARSHENLLGVNHDIFQIPSQPNDNFYNVVVPKGKYFMMGDNRDNSADSRYWGFMSEKNIIGKADYVIGSYDKPTHPIRWERVGMKIV